MIAKPSTQHCHSIDSQVGPEHTPTVRRQFATEMELRTAQISVEAFIHAFLPEREVPAGLDVKAFDPTCFETRESRMYPELVSHSKWSEKTGSLIAHFRSAKS